MDKHKFINSNPSYAKIFLQTGLFSLGFASSLVERKILYKPA